MRPMHPGMAVAVPTVRPRATNVLVSASERVTGSQHALQISLGILQLHDHPLFREEHVLQYASPRARAIACENPHTTLTEGVPRGTR